MGDARWKRRIVAGLLLVAMTASGCSSFSNNSSSEMDSAAPMEGSAGSDMSPGGNYAGERYDGGTAMTANQAMEEAPRAPETSASAGAGSSVTPAGGVPSAVEAAVGRMLIYRANIAMEVESYADAYSEVQNLIHLSSGYIIQFSEHTSGAERSGVFTVKVPAGDYDGFLQQLEQLPHVSLNRSMTAQDVSEEYVDLEARLRAKEVLESRYLTFMQKATATDDLVRFANELAAVQEQIEQLKGRMRYLEQNVAFSTVELRIYEKLTRSAAAGIQRTGLAERMGDALQSSLNVLVSVAEGVMVVIAGAVPIAIVAAAVAVPVLAYVRRRSKKAKQIDD